MSNPSNKKTVQELPSERELEAREEELRNFVQVIVGHLNRRIEDLERVKEDLQKIHDPCRLDDLPFEDSQFGGQWLSRNQAPDWSKTLKYPLQTSKFKYYLSKQGNLKRYPPKTNPAETT